MSRKFYRYQLPALFFMVLIFIGSSISVIPAPRLNLRLIDKWAHVIEYGILGYLLARALFNQDSYPKCRDRFLILAAVIGALYGVSDEIHQYFVPSRYFEVNDMIADAIGSLLGAVLFSYVQGRKNASRQR